jgi:hypothetical protein
MMMSMKKVLPKTLPFVLIVFAIFTISLTENLQIADGFLSESTAGWKYELSPGESQVFTWTLTNTEEKSINLEFRAEGQGSELFVFEELVTMQPNEHTAFEFIVTVPEDHPDNIEYHPQLFALEVAERSSDTGAAILINYEMLARPIIKIGDNPVFTPEPIPVIIEEEAIVKERPSEEDFSVTIPTETLEEKMARIQAANQPKEVIVDDVWEEEFEEEAVKEYVPEPMSDPEPVTAPVVAIVTVEECGWWDMILSLFGMAKC